MGQPSHLQVPQPSSSFTPIWGNRHRNLHCKPTPPNHIRPRCSIPGHLLPIDQQILPRALAGLQRGLAALPELPPFPDLQLQVLTQLQSVELSDGHADSEQEVAHIGGNFVTIAGILVKAIFQAADNSTPSVKRNTPRLLYSQHGVCNMATISVTPYLSSTVSMEWKQMEVVLAHFGNDGLQKVLLLNSLQETDGAAAIATKASKPDGRRSAKLIEIFSLVVPPDGDCPRPLSLRSSLCRPCVRNYGAR